MFSRVSKSVIRLLALTCVVLVPLALGAQNSANSAAKTSSGDSASKWDIFAGYSFMAPNASVEGSAEKGTTKKGQYVPDGVSFETQKVGTTFSVARYWNERWGFQVDSGQHDVFLNCSTWTPAYASVPPYAAIPSPCFSNSGLYTVQAGVIRRWTGDKTTSFIHVLGGGAISEGPAHQGWTPGWTTTIGGGVDYKLNQRWAYRIFQGDYEFVDVRYGDPHYSPTNGWQPGGTAQMEGIRLSTGVVYHAGAMAPPTSITLMCSANPASVFPGDPVTVTAMAGDVEPKMNVIYSLSGAGVNSSATRATVATGALAPGAYTVNCGVKEGRFGKEGLKPWESATASASFTVKQFEPPTISCAVSPTTIKPGDSAIVTATAVSPQSRPLTYSYTASAGSIQGNGTTATYSSVGAPIGPVTITCTVTDDKGQSASTTINAANTLTITAPYVAPVPHTQSLCSISFAGDKERPSRVNNEAKACLDEVALDLQKQSDAQAVVVGSSDAKEKAALKNKHLKVMDLAAERAVNVKGYLVTEKGIDASRVSVATSAADGQTVEDYLVPAGANFSADVTGTTPVSAEVKAEPRKPLHPVAHKKPAAAKKAAKPAK